MSETVVGGGTGPVPPPTLASPSNVVSSYLRRTMGVVIWLTVTVGAMLVLVGGAAAGWRLQVISSRSMEPAVPRGSLAVVAPVGGNEARRGTVVSFRDPADESRQILHRVVEVITTHDGSRFLRTRGDANETEDPILVPQANVTGRLSWHVPAVGRAAWRLRHPVGRAILVGAPCLLLTFTELRRRRQRAAGAGHPAGVRSRLWVRRRMEEYGNVSASILRPIDELTLLEGLARVERSLATRIPSQGGRVDTHRRHTHTG